MRDAEMSLAIIAASFFLLEANALKVAGVSELLNWWKMPAPEAGRNDFQHHSPRCCYAEDCLAQDRGARAFVTSLRSPEYLILLKELKCSITKHSPDVRFVVISVAGDLEQSIIDEVQSFAEYRELEEFAFPNDVFPRFSKNWVKLRVWNMTDLDAVVMLDSDIVLQGDIRHLFSLPTDFAWVTDAAPGAHETHSGGLVLLRPCRAVADDMIQVVQSRPELRKLMAEQDFLAWYFRYVGLKLPSMYNTNFLIWHEQTGQKTAGGEKPLALHFSDRKLFEVCPSDPEWRFLCHRPGLVSAGADVSALDSSPSSGIRCGKGKPGATAKGSLGGSKSDDTPVNVDSNRNNEGRPNRRRQVKHGIVDIRSLQNHARD